VLVLVLVALSTGSCSDGLIESKDRGKSSYPWQCMRWGQAIVEAGATLSYTST